MMVRRGFTQGRACPNVFWHRERGLTCSVHGDDFATCGPKRALDWFESALQEEYEVSIAPRMGPGPQDAKEGRALNRVIRWLDDSISYEADPRQVERLVEECGMVGSTSMATPSVRATFSELEQDTELRPEMHKAFRGAAARANYLAADRVDSQFACKEVCRYMARPTVHAFQALKRLCRYLVRGTTASIRLPTATSQSHRCSCGY